MMIYDFGSNLLPLIPEKGSAEVEVDLNARPFELQLGFTTQVCDRLQHCYIHGPGAGDMSTVHATREISVYGTHKT